LQAAALKRTAKLQLQQMKTELQLQELRLYMTTKAMNKKLKCFNDFEDFKRLYLYLNPTSTSP
jgi:hypothetical protein